MKKDDETTKVIFRKFAEGDVVALFPEIPASNYGFECMSYQTIGQHGAASPDIVNWTTPASPDDYKELFDELQNRIGYNLKIVKKFTYRDYEKRKRAL